MRYSERLHPAGWIWAVAVVMGLGFGLSLWPVGQTVAVATAVLVAAVLLALLIRSTPTVAVADGRLQAGRASIPVALTGEVQVLDPALMRHAHGPDLDARAHLCLRGWIPGGIRVELTDPQDPTPYWLISSRHPERLALALLEERA